MDSNEVKAILFDLDNTLIDTSRAIDEGLKEPRELLKTKLGLNDDDAHSIGEKFKQKLFHADESAAGQSQDDLRVRHWEESILETVGSRSTPSLAAECYYSWKKKRLEMLKLSPEVCKLLKQLRCRYKTLLLTNGDAQTQKEKVEAVKCEKYFDAVVIAGDYEEQKPFPSIFQVCFSLLEVKAQDCIMVGDSLSTDILGGFNAGVRATVWINKDGTVTDGSVKPNYTIPSVLNLPDILAKLQ